jgi:hypothetical protein
MSSSDWPIWLRDANLSCIYGFMDTMDSSCDWSGTGSKFGLGLRIALSFWEHNFLRASKGPIYHWEPRLDVEDFEKKEGQFILPSGRHHAFR